MYVLGLADQQDLKYIIFVGTNNAVKKTCDGR